MLGDSNIACLSILLNGASIAKVDNSCRFVLNERNLNSHGYYQANIDCNDYIEDLNNIEPNIDRTGLIQKYTNLFKMKK